MVEPIVGVLPLPAAPTEILEASEVAAEVWANHTLADGAEGVLKVWVNLNLGRGGRLK